MSTRASTDSTWNSFGVGLLVGGSVALVSACVIIPTLAYALPNDRGKSRGRDKAPGRNGDRRGAENFDMGSDAIPAAEYFSAGFAPQDSPSSVIKPSTKNGRPARLRVNASRTDSSADPLVVNTGYSTPKKPVLHAMTQPLNMPSASTHLPDSFTPTSVGSPPKSVGSPTRSGLQQSLKSTSGAFHVTTLQKQQQQQRPPPHMMLQNTPAPSTANTTSRQKSAGLLSLATIPFLSDPKERGRNIEEAAVNDDYCRVITAEATMTEEDEAVCHNLVQALDLRWKWLFRPLRTPMDMAGEPEAACPSQLRDPFEYCQLPPSPLTFKMFNGVYKIFNDPECTQEVFPVPGTDKEYFTDMLHMLRVGAAGPVKTYTHHRLVLLEQKFNLHVMVNADKEYLAQKIAPHRDFYNVRKVDTHVHHSACMHQKHLLRFIKSKLRKESDEIVIFRDGKFLTLREVFESLNLTSYDLNVDTLDMHADKTIFHRFDKFNLKYNPFGQSRLREIFVKQDNLLHGRFLAELTKEVFSDLEDTKYQHTEYRISIYGRKTKEWDILAAWVCQNKLYSDNNVWLIQIPRLYNIYKAQGLLDNYEQMIINIFQPLFEVTMDPESHPQLSIFLQQVVGVDMVDDESKPERRPTKNMPKPVNWDNKYNPAYSYYCYYTYANLYTLNKLRESRGLNTFTFRPHAGEAGEIDHLASAFMLCDNIAHGINLRKSPFLQYLYYLAQVGLCMSPLSNNSLFLDYHKNPFPVYFARGLSVSLSTDDPLQIHLTKEPLVEEFSVAANMWKLSSTDTCEVARNGVLHSGFPHACKKHWISSTYFKPGPEGNDIHKTNVPNLRMRFRFDTHQEEMRLLYLGAMEHAKNGPYSLKLD